MKRNLASKYPSHIKCFVALLGVCIFSSLSSYSQSYHYIDSWGPEGFSLESQSNTSVEINYSIHSYGLSQSEINGRSQDVLSLPGTLLPGNEGAPNLPGTGRFIAIPRGSTAHYEIVSYRTETYRDIDIAPSPRIPWETDDSPLEYARDKSIYSKDAYYPLSPVLLSEVTQIRGVDVVTLGITPFQYNPVSKELLVYRDLKVRVSFTGGTGHIGEDRLRSRWWDPLMEDMFLNSASLPKVNYNKSYLAKDDIGCDYLIITPTNEEFLQWADSIRSFRTQQGILTQVMTVEEAGGNDVNTLEAFFDEVYYEWDLVPSAVLILGDYGTNSDDRILSPIWDSYCASDNIWADVTGNDMPDFIFARMTARDADDLEVMVSKFLEYERTPPTSEEFYDHPITALGFQTSRWFQICSETVAGFWENELGKSPVRINAVYSGYPTTDPWSTAPNTSTILDIFGPDGLGYLPSLPGDVDCSWNGTAQDVVDAINAGSFMLQHRDHGSEYQWGEPEFYSSDIDNLTNMELPFIWSVNCLTGKYNMTGECFAEKFHRYTYNGENSGALGLNAASETSYSFVNDAYAWGAYDNMWPEFLPDYGSTTEERGILPAFGMVAGKYFLEQSGWPYNIENKLVTYHLFHHHGDAFNTIYSEVPMELTVAHVPILLAGEVFFEVTADAAALIALTVDGQIIGTAEGTGEALEIAIPGQVPPKQMIVTVTKQNYLRYSAVVDIIPPEGPYVVMDAYFIHDESGNNDGMMDYGESNLLSLTMENVGVVQAENVVVTLSSSDEFITITDGEESYGSIEAGAQAMIEDGFSYNVDAAIPDGRNVEFEVSANDGDQFWLSYLTIKGHAPVLEFVNYNINDESGNGNGKIDPGETVEIMIEIKNDGSSEAHGIEGLLSSGDPYLTMVTGNSTFGNLSPGDNSTALFMVSAAEDTPVGHMVSLQIDMEGDLGISGTALFDVVIGHIPVLILNLDGSNSSAASMEQSLTSLGVAYETWASFPQDLNLYSSLFICLGVYADNHVLTSFEGQLIADFLDAGGGIYMEGGDTWYWDEPTAAHAKFNINGLMDGSSDLSIINGTAGEFTAGLSFNYSEDNSWIDRLEAIAPAEPIFENQSPNYITAVAYDEGTYRTIGASHEFGGLVDGMPPSSKQTLMSKYLNFLGLTLNLQAFFGTGETETCTGEPVEFLDLSAGDVTSWEWTFEGGTPAVSSVQNPTVIYENPGSFDVSLEVSDGAETAILMLEAYITASGNPAQSAKPEGEEAICTNTSTSTEYTTQGAGSATAYAWEINPPEAGTISGTGTISTVTWTPAWEGTAYISVRGINDCGEGDYSAELEVQCSVCTGIPSLTKESGVAIFPNPSNGSFTIRFNDNFGETDVMVANLFGEVIYQMKTNTDSGVSLFVDLGEFAEGIYFVKLNNDSAEFVQKVIIR